MAYELYSGRQKRARQEQEPYTYDEIPEGLRWQIFCVVEGFLDTNDLFLPLRKEGKEWKDFWRAIRQEKQLRIPPGRDPEADFRAYLIKQASVEDVLDIIVIAIRFAIRNKFPVQAAVSDLNIYFRRESVGYKLVIGSKSGEVLVTRIDSEFLHSEAIVPALALLRKEGFETAHKKFLSAHKHYRDGKHGDCITHANSAFESTMKIICEQRGWKYGRGTAKDLIAALHTNGLITGPSQKHLKQLADILESGLPLLRNKQSSAHGQGTNAAEPPAHTAAYALHLAAANILFLVQSAAANQQR